jgi:hypothetical protein
MMIFVKKPHGAGHSRTESWGVCLVCRTRWFSLEELTVGVGDRPLTEEEILKNQANEHRLLE